VVYLGLSSDGSYLFRKKTDILNTTLLTKNLLKHRLKRILVCSIAEKSEAPFLQWLGSSFILIALLHFWIRHFTTIIYAWWLGTCCKLTGKKSKIKLQNLDIGNSLANEGSSKIYCNHRFLV